ncbi:PD-(D/E)XK nuclease family protein [Isoptericola sp. F-RaC21]|uniref:PD-(D/E)XK nuclease family protein n=1 Tax=Isoptericola sp. F-RaC21 TaxID=3141452 RepID=UPI00315B9913
MLRTVRTPHGAPALDALRTVVSELKHHDPMTQVVVVAPTHLAGTVARRHLARYGIARPGAPSRPGIAGLEVTTLTRLAERLAAPSLAPRRPATGPVVAAAWRAALTRDPGLFHEVADHTATVEALTAAHRELRDVDPADLDALEADGPATTRDLVRLHRDVTALLASDWYDARDLLDAATAGVGAITEPVVLYLPQDLTLPERRFVDALAAATDVVVIAGETGTKRGDAHLTRLAVAQLAADTEDAPHVPTATRIANASDSDDEVRGAVREVVAALRRNNARADRIAVLYTARDPYARLLHEHLAEAGIRVNGPGSRPVVDRALARTVLDLLALGPADVPRADLFRALAGAPVRDFAGARIPVSRWERLSREAGIVGGPDWGGRLADFVAAAERIAAADEDDARPGAVERARRRAETGAELLAFTTRLRDELARGAEIASWRELSVWALNLVTTLIGDGPALQKLPPEEQYAATAVTSVLRGLVVLDDVGADASLEALADVLRAELENTRPRVGEAGDGVLVAPPSSAVGLDLDTVVVVGLSEDLYPGRPRTDALLPEVVRTAVEPLRAPRDRLNTQFRHLLAAFASAPDAVASFPRGDLRSSSQRLPSRWLLASLRALADDPTLPATGWEDADYGGAMATAPSFAGGLRATPRLATGGEWRVRAALAGGLDDDVATAARELLAARRSPALTRFDGNLTGVSGLPDYTAQEQTISPTTLEKYATCPHAFFVERLLSVRPIEQPEEIVTVRSLDVGNIVHGAYERLVAECRDAGDLPGPGAPWPEPARRRLAEITRDLCDDVERRGLSGHPRMWDDERTRIEADVLALLDADDAWRADLGARPVASEQRFGFDDGDSAPAVEVAVTGPDDGARGRVRLRGSIDKVDVGAGGIVYVTDIKTGSRTKFKDIRPGDELVGGSKLQLPVYGMAARDAFGDGTAGVAASYWFVRKDPGRIEVPLTPELEDRFATTIGVLTRSIAAGLFPLRPPAAPDFAYTQCPYCNPDSIGHGEARGRWEGKRLAPELAELVGLLEPDALPAPGTPDGTPDGGDT